LQGGADPNMCALHCQRDGLAATLCPPACLAIVCQADRWLPDILKRYQRLLCLASTCGNTLASA